MNENGYDHFRHVTGDVVEKNQGKMIVIGQFSITLSESGQEMSGTFNIQADNYILEGREGTGWLNNLAAENRFLYETDEPGHEHDHDHP